MDHYYSEQPSAPSRPIALTYTTPGGRALRLTSDAGVFSKEHVDLGSDLLIRSLPRQFSRALDMGCGYGPVGLSLAADCPAGQVVLSDINARAAALSAQNARDNRLDNAQVVQGDLFAAVTGDFDLIATNPPIRTGKRNIYALFAQAWERLRPGGTLYVVIRKQQGAASAKAELARIFGVCETIARGSGFHVLKATRASSD